MRNAIITNVNGRDIAIRGVPPDTMALAWLRSEGLISVKEGCGEGDCGACTIALGTPNNGALEWREVASCLLFLPMLDGRAVLTAEGLKGPDGTPHPVQKAMAEGFGTQCGFCSPGITMSLFAQSRRPAGGKDAILDGLAGNLCRCTGYRPILDVAHALPSQPPAAGEAALAESLAAATALPLAYDVDGRSFVAPDRLADALAYRAAHPEAWIVAGGTDIGLAVTKRHQLPGAVLSLSRIAELTGIRDHAGGLTIGAAAPYTDILRAISNRHPNFAALLRRVGATQVRNQGSFGGNLGTASPIGDSIPCLIALDAEIEVASSAGRRRIAAADFVTGYRSTALAADELIVAVHLPDLPEAHRFHAYKLAKRVDQDISTVSAAFCLLLDKGRVAGIRAAFGGVAARAQRAHKAEAALLGQPWAEHTVAAAKLALAEDISPMTDLRGSADYRRKAAANLIERLWRETSEHSTFPVTLEEV